MAEVPVGIKFDPQQLAWFTANSSEVFADGIVIYCNEAPNKGYYKIADGVTTLGALPFLGGGGQVDSVTGTPNRISVDNTDPANPVVDISSVFADSKADKQTGLLSGGGLTIVTDDITVSEATYYIVGFGEFSSPETAFNNIALSGAGNQRFVAFYGNSSGAVVKVEGAEGAVASMPSTPANTALINYSLVTDGDIGSGVDLSGYMLKSDKATAADVSTGTNDTKYITALGLLNSGKYALSTVANTKTIVLFKRTTPITHTGTVSPTKVESLFIPANTLGANDKIELSCRIMGTNANNHTLRIKVNTIDSLSGATQLAIYTFTLTPSYMKRNMWFNNSTTNISVLSPVTSYANDEISGAAYNNVGEPSFNIAVGNYFIFEIENAVSGDTTKIFEYSAKIIRGAVI